MTASPMSQGEAWPLPSESRPHVAQAPGMNWAGPWAPAEEVAVSRLVSNFDSCQI
ncbi:hypothetical protein SBADM41S_03786 [Streptomyces badius]